MLTALTIARTTFLEAVRQPVYFLLIVICGMAMFLTTWGTGFSMGYTEVGEVSGDNKFLLDLGLATVFVCGLILAALVATSAMSREIENKTVLTVVSKPVARPVVVLGKYLGVVSAVMIAVAIMILFLVLALRHGVMSTAAQDLDMPVLTLSFGALAISMAIGVWCNFFYGSSFPQVASLTLLPTMTLATFGALMVGANWNLVSPRKLGIEEGTAMIVVNFKPQVLIACSVLAMAMTMLCAVAVGASTRLGQVMTIVICFGVFGLGMLSGPFIGRHAYNNNAIGTVLKAEPEALRFQEFRTAGDVYLVTLKAPPPRPLTPGEPVYYGPFPNGFALETPAFEPIVAIGPDGQRATATDALARAATSPALAVIGFDQQNLLLTVRNFGPGGEGLAVGRPPQPEDYIFLTPTRVNAAALIAWGMIPNLQFYWLMDAVGQNQAIPFSHWLLVLIYTVVQVAIALAVAVLLFQRRDVG
ncbi:MAG: ABC transporter permease [bacterium]|jgi:ABC-2 type transport system permease protein|nr:ABC transporter permease [Phycisphaerales bacterium]MCE2653052.1 ABC transporter permease [Planctomycetaceae bacterium]